MKRWCHLCWNTVLLEVPRALEEKGNRSFQTHLRRGRKNTYGNNRNVGKTLKHALFLGKKTKDKWEYFSKKWHHRCEREVGWGMGRKGPSSKVLNLRRWGGSVSTRIWRAGPQVSCPFPGPPKDSVPRKRGLTWLSQKNPVCGRRLGDAGEKGSENPALQLSLVRLRSPRIMEYHCP